VGDDDNHFATLRIVGVMSESSNGSEYNHLDASRLKNSLAHTNTGDLIVNVEIVASGIDVEEGDLVTMEFNEGSLSIKVNGTYAVDKLAGLTFTNKFHWLSN
jgi:hypothetical protein